MSAKRILTIVLVAGAVILAIGIGSQAVGMARALPSSQAGVTIPYSGHLTDEASRPVADGTYAFIFRLYNAETGGEPLWTETQEGVTVQGGAFVALLGSVNGTPQETLDGGERWLEIAVRGPGEANFTALAPRQRLSAASPTAPASPAAGPACPHDHWGENWVGSTPADGPYGLRVENTGAGDALQGWAIDPIRSGVYGRHRGDGYGVFGRGTSGYGGGFTSDNDHLDLFLGGAVGRINANEQDGSQLYLSSNADVIVKLDNDGGGDHVFRIKNSGGSDVFTVNEAGNMWAAGPKSALVATEQYGDRLLYAMESPEVWFEDFGSVSLVNGAATVAFDPVFAETINLEEDYHVFVTPLSQEPVLLFVTAKSAAGFTVRGVTLDGKPALCGFDYRVVAKRLGYEKVRLKKTERQEGE